MHDVAILHDILLAFHREFSCLAHSSLGAIFDVVVVLDDLGTDEALLEVCVDDPGTLRSLPALVIGPRLHLHLACRDEGFEIKQCISRLDEACHARFLKADLGEEHLTVLIGVQLRDVGLSLSGHNKQFGILFLDGLAHLVNISVSIDGTSLVHVAHVEHGL